MDKYHEEAPEGYVYVLTEKGLENTPDHVKVEREVGKPVRRFEDKVPTSWIKKGYVILKQIDI